MFAARIAIGLCLLAVVTLVAFQASSRSDQQTNTAETPQAHPTPPTAQTAPQGTTTPTAISAPSPSLQSTASVPMDAPLYRNATLAQVFGEKPISDYLPGDRLTLHLSATQELSLVITSSEDNAVLGSHSLAAQIEGSPLGRIAISTSGDTIYASINGADVGNYEIRRVADTDRLKVNRITPADDLQCATEDHLEMDSDADTAAPNTPSTTRRTIKALGATTTIDIAIFFNDQARVVLGGSASDPTDDADIRAKIATAVTDANSTMVDSNVPTTFRVVDLQPIEYVYPPTENLDRALREVRSISDGSIDQIHALRDAAEADIVSLWIENGVSGGLANVTSQSNIGLKNAFNVIRAQNPTSTFVHEIGHNHGCRHLRSSYSSTPFSYFPDSFAHLFTTSGGSKFTTVVASTSDTSSAGATRILRLSAPELAYFGTPTGVTDDTNNAATFRTSGPIIADFRGATDTPLPGPDFDRPTLKLKSKSKVKTRRPRVTIRGNATDNVAVDRIAYKASGQRGLKNAEGLRRWKIKIRLKKRRTVVKVFAFDTVNNRSRPQKVKVIRTR